MAGITGITKGRAALTVPPDAPPDEVWRYGLGFPFQVAPRKAGLFCTSKVRSRRFIAQIARSSAHKPQSQRSRRTPIGPVDSENTKMSLCDFAGFACRNPQLVGGNARTARTSSGFRCADPANSK